MNDLFASQNQLAGLDLGTISDGHLKAKKAGLKSINEGFACHTFQAQEKVGNRQGVTVKLIGLCSLLGAKKATSSGSPLLPALYQAASGYM